MTHRNTTQKVNNTGRTNMYRTKQNEILEDLQSITNKSKNIKKEKWKKIADDKDLKTEMIG